MKEIEVLIENYEKVIEARKKVAITTDAIRIMIATQICTFEAVIKDLKKLTI
jgi:hypothetical protein